MIAYIKVATQEYPLHQGDIILEHPELENNFVLPEGYAPVRIATPPAYDKSVSVLESQPPVLQNGEWIANWSVRMLTPEELQLREQLPPIIAEMDRLREESEIKIPEPLPPKL